jgi:hypothetical protein
MSRSKPAFRFPLALDRALGHAAWLGAGVFVLGLFVAPGRVWGGYLMGFYHLTTWSLAGALFISLLKLARARWAAPLLCIPQAMSAPLRHGLALGVLLLFGIHALYEWSHLSVVAVDPLLQHKQPWLNTPFFSLRMVLYFVVWLLLARRLMRPPLDQDRGWEPRHERSRYLAACAFLPAFAVTFSLASIDWIGSLEPHWFSTIFALVTLAGLALGGMAVVLILVVALRRQGAMRDLVTDDHLDDLAKITLGLSLFWAYILYCQHMIIWYSNIPEETGYYVLRGQGGWPALRMASLALNFGVPFLVLLLRRARRSEAVLLRVAMVLIAGRLLDVYVVSAPPILGQASVGVWELGPVLGALALYFRVTLRALAAAPSAAVQGPRLVPVGAR